MKTPMRKLARNWLRFAEFMSNVSYAKPEDFFSDVGTKNEVAAYRAQGYDEATIVSCLRRTSRVNARTPMQWDASPFAGFSGKAGVNPVNDNYKQGVNVGEEMSDPYSILNFFQYAIAERKDPVINDQVLHDCGSANSAHHGLFGAVLVTGPPPRRQ